jgi:hypothetical protein
MQQQRNSQQQQQPTVSPADGTKVAYANTLLWRFVRAQPVPLSCLLSSQLHK